jgi:hypothetical protein
LVLCIGVLTAFVVAVPGTAGVESSLCDAGGSVVPGERVGLLSIGADDDVARERLGGESTDVAAPPLTYVSYDEGRYAGFGYYVQDHRVAMVTLIMEYSTVAECTTPAGIRLGSTAGDVRNAYGPPQRTYELPSGEARLWVYDDLGITFAMLHLEYGDQVGVIEVYPPRGYCAIRTLVRQVGWAAFDCDDFTSRLKVTAGLTLA